MTHPAGIADSLNESLVELDKARGGSSNDDEIAAYFDSLSIAVSLLESVGVPVVWADDPAEPEW